MKWNNKNKKKKKLDDFWKLKMVSKITKKAQKERSSVTTHNETNFQSGKLSFELSTWIFKSSFLIALNKHEIADLN